LVQVVLEAQMQLLAQAAMIRYLVPLLLLVAAVVALATERQMPMAQMAVQVEGPVLIQLQLEMEILRQ
jgi:hypothetical protein